MLNLPDRRRKGLFLSGTARSSDDGAIEKADQLILCSNSDKYRV
jgi:hypothetical protein